jgi:hypothetical protein
MSDTPETDHIEKNLGNAAHPILSSFCRRLERERNEARELLREIRDDEVNAQDECDKFLRDHVPSELSKVTEQRDRLAKILHNIRSGYGGQIPDPDCHCGDCEFLIKIDTALQFLTTTEP